MIVVTGATGNVGRPLVEALVTAGEEVTAVARRIAAQDVPAEVAFQQADLLEPENLKPALDGAEALFLLTSGEFMGAGGNLGDVLEVARAADVRRVVLLSSQGVVTGRHPSNLEKAVQQSSLEWTMLRPSGFYSNALQWAKMVRTQRMVAAPFGDVAIPGIDPADIAEVAAVALRDARHVGNTYTLTGPAPVSPRQQAAAIEAALGEPVRFAEQSREEARAQMLRFMPEPVVESTLDILGLPSAEEQQVSPDVEQVLRRPARTFSEWAARNIAAFK
ncbi:MULTISPECIES: NAD(P)H-binding protein [unclassified Pseudofrankia]|uniref:NAD(P)H-binding protein n=1 Tax=unclassified Pseudofrankia TaxID=2994372 RepID=UPI0008DB17ED|nr:MULTISPECIES: NAD(P)H-binding protein [unclassified Pseudofrankia]MDT3442860.1 NAD(P)H-binding protein [Pseudofrankia sp. BMG5.37]OHV74306.1 NmrA family transcriptional regulator [Pseudofrankia sp. BMG5.36]